MQRFDEAFVDFTHALELGKHKEWPLFGMSIAYALTQKPHETLEHLKQAIEIDPTVKRDAAHGHHYRMAFEPLCIKDPAFAKAFDALVLDEKESDH